MDDRVHCLPGSGSSWLQNSHYVRLRSARGQGPQEDFVEDLKKKNLILMFTYFEGLECAYSITCGGQRKMCRSWFSLPITSVPGLKFRSSGLVKSAIT